MPRQRRSNSAESQRLTDLRERRRRLKIQLTLLRARTEEAEAELHDVEDAIRGEMDRVATESAREHATASERVIRLFEQNVDPALIAETLTLPREQVAQIIEERQQAARFRRARFPDHD